MLRCYNDKPLVEEGWEQSKCLDTHAVSQCTDYAHLYIIQIVGSIPSCIRQSFKWAELLAYKTDEPGAISRTAQYYFIAARNFMCVIFTKIVGTKLSLKNISSKSSDVNIGNLTNWWIFKFCLKTCTYPTQIGAHTAFP